MPRIDPHKLLTCLSVLLAPNGGIRSSDEVKRLAGLMDKFSKKLVSKCIYIQICKSTETELLDQFMAAGGWSLTHSWLSDGIISHNWPLVRELLELLLLCPVDVARLKSNSAPKLVKQLSKEGSEESVKILATKLVEQWLKIVKGETMAAMTGDKPKKDQQLSNVQSTETKTNLLINNNSEILNKLTKNTALTISSNKNNVFVQDKVTGEKDSLVINNENETVIENQDSVDENSKSSSNLTSDSKKDGQFKSIVNTSGVSITDDKHVSNNEESKLTNKEREKSMKDKSKEKSTKDRDKSKDKDKHRSSHKSSHSSSSSSSKSRSHSHSSSSSSKSSSSNGHKSSSSKTNSSSHRDKHKSSSTKSSSSSNSSKDSSNTKEKSKEKDEKNQAEKDKDTLTKIAPPSIDKLCKIPKKSKESDKQKDDNDKQSNTTTNSVQPPLKRNPSISIEVRKDNENRPKTVKTFNSQFRSHGLAEEAPPPPPRKCLKKQNTPTPAIAIPTVLPTKRLSPPKETVVEKKLKLDISVIDKPGAIKIIAPKSKPSQLIESDMFMDALSSASMVKKEPKKRKRRPSTSKDSSINLNSSPPSSPTTPTSPKVLPAAPLKFYQDTLEDNSKEEKDTSNTETKSKDVDSESKTNNDEEDEDNIPLKKLKETVEKETSKDSEEPERDAQMLEPTDEPKQPGPGTGPNGPPGVLVIHRRRGPKKSLSWKPQESLEEVRYFELDETERVNVTKTFSDAKQMERCQEREYVLTVKNKFHGVDRMCNEIEWSPLIEIDGIPSHLNETRSNEKEIQAKREKTVLQVIYFSPYSIPDSPSEPDVESFEYVKPKVIPLCDIVGIPDAICDLTSMPWPEPKGDPPSNVQSANMPAFNSKGFLPMDMQRQQWPMFQNGPINRMPTDGNSTQFSGPSNNFNGMQSMNNNMNNINFPMNIMNMNLNNNMMNNMGPMHMKEAMNNLINMRNNSGNWFRPGGPPPNWIKNQEGRGGGDGGGRRGGYNNHNRNNWNNRGHGRGFGGGYKNKF